MTSQSLLDLSHTLGQEARGLAILGEGNTSARLTDDTFLVKASGSNLQTLDEAGIVECRFAPLLEMLNEPHLTDEEIEARLFGCRVHESARKPSVEALFHALLLQEEGVAFVGHAHPIACNAILCSPRAQEFARKPMFPDQIVCCGPACALVPYVDPGLSLARAIRESVEQFRVEYGRTPRVILLQNHGVITLGATPSAVLAAMLMIEKSAQIFLGATALGGPVFLSGENVRRIDNRLDEHYRQQALNL